MSEANQDTECQECAKTICFERSGACLVCRLLVRRLDDEKCRRLFEEIAEQLEGSRTRELVLDLGSVVTSTSALYGSLARLTRAYRGCISVTCHESCQRHLLETSDAGDLFRVSGERRNQIEKKPCRATCGATGL